MGSNLVVHDCIHMHSDRILGQNLWERIFICITNSVSYDHLLRRNIKGGHPHVHLGVAVHAGDDEEDAWSSGTPRQKTTQAEDDCSLILLKSGVDHNVPEYKDQSHLNNLDSEEKAEGEGEEDHEEGEEGDKAGTDTRTISTLAWTKNRP